MVGRAAVYFQSFFQSKAVSTGDDLGRIDEVLEDSREQAALRISEEAWLYSPVSDNEERYVELFAVMDSQPFGFN